MQNKTHHIRSLADGLLRFLLAAFGLLLLFNTVYFPALATIDARGPLINKIEFPEEFSFAVSDSCQGHYYFIQAAAQEDGTFVVCSHYIHPEGASEDTFKRQHIDIYNENGLFIKELSFATTQPYAVALADDVVYIYFYSYVVTFDLETEELQCYDVLDRYASYDATNLDEFTSGQWQYRCVKATTGYKKLIRTNGATEQVLVDMPGSGSIVKRTLPGGIIGAATVATLLIVQLKKRKNKQST